MTAKEYLGQIEKIDILIKNKTYERNQWYDIATVMTSNLEGDRVQGSGDKQKMAAAVSAYSDIDNVILDLKKQKEEIIASIEELPAIEYDILHDIYVKYITLDKIAEKHEKSYSWATSMHGTALKHLADTLSL